MRGDTEKINVVNYLTRNPLMVRECSNEEDTYAMNDQRGGGFLSNPKVYILIIGAKVKESKFKNYSNYNR